MTKSKGSRVAAWQWSISLMDHGSAKDALGVESLNNFRNADSVFKVSVVTECFFLASISVSKTSTLHLKNFFFSVCFGNLNKPGASFVKL